MSHMRTWQLISLVAFVICDGGCALPKQEDPLLAKLRALGADLPVRRSELIAECGLKNSFSTRLHMGLRGGWGGVYEEWLLVDGSTLIGYHHRFVGIIRIDRQQIDDLLKNSGDTPLPFQSGMAAPPPTTWFNGLALVDRKNRVLYSNSKLTQPAAQ